MQKLLHFDCL